jgi:hypothetical protein
MVLTWSWTRATGVDVGDIVKMAQADFQSEVEGIFIPDPVAYARNITMACVNQFYCPTSELLLVARDPDLKLVAYVWVIKQLAPWSDESMAAVRMVHLALNLTARDRIRLVQQMIGLVEVWATESACPVVCSTTMRRDQEGFLRLHERKGYDVRGSICYKRLAI